MSLNSDSSLITISKLSENWANYAAWAFQMKFVFKSHGIWDIVNGTERRPPDFAIALDDTISDLDDLDPNDLEKLQKIEDWREGDFFARHMLRAAISETQLVHVPRSPGTAKQAWDALARTHEMLCLTAPYFLMRVLAQAQYQDGDNLEEHIAELLNASRALAEMGEPVKDHHLGIFILQSLPQSWDTFIFIMKILAGNTMLSSETVITRILSENNRRKIGTSSTNTSDSAAPSSQPRNRQKREKSKIKCYACGKKGHHGDECRSKKQVDADVIRTGYAVVI